MGGVNRPPIKITGAAEQNAGKDIWTSNGAGNRRNEKDFKICIIYLILLK
jgi:hypothetical protein